jgi:hypothetical protein
VASLIWAAHNSLPQAPERAVQVVAGALLAVLAVPVAGCLVRRNGWNEPRRLSLIVLAIVGVWFLGIYLYWVAPYVFSPADILIWSEGGFVTDIVKWRTGYPLYSAPQNNESFIYTPGAQLLTYFLAWLVGQATSIPAYRLIQVGFTLLAAVVGGGARTGAFCIRE